MPPFEYLQKEIAKIKDLETERSFYPILKEFLIGFAKEELKLHQDVNVISEASSKIHESKVGFPDLTIQIKLRDYQTIGWVEVKLPKDSLSNPNFQPQFHRYTDSLENVVITNLREWVLYQWDDKGKPKKVAECLYDVSSDSGIDHKPIISLLQRFFEGKALELKTPKQLALALARKTRLLSQEVQDNLQQAIDDNETDNDLIKLYGAFSRTLIQNLQVHQFANMAAETIAYSFFLAALEHQKRGNTELLTFSTTNDYLPKSVPILTDLYELIGKAAKNSEAIRLTVDSLIEQFQKADMEKIYAKLTHHKLGEDPVIYFYEPFLAEYDPKEREARGVYYTPKPVVDYIVKSVDYLLKEKFGKIGGIDDPAVRLLDPATGTGTFLMSAMELVHDKRQKQFGPLGDEVVKKEFVRAVQGHILKHFYGFELMIAPYAIAHLKLRMLLEGFGFDFETTKDTENERLKIYLTNTLEEPHKSEDEEMQMNMFSFHKTISEESALASNVKSKEPIMAIVGNPPYSGHSSNNGDWIRGLVKDYYFVDGKPLGERNPKWLQDDYVKFIRFAQWKIEQTGEGVIGFVTNHSYLDNPTFRGMRQQLMQHFNEIHVLDLHGNSLKKEKTPEGGKDENVFNIQAGVAIVFLVKKRGVEGCEIYRSDLQGLKTDKLALLEENRIETTKWEKLEPRGEFYLFKKEDAELAGEYEKFMKVNEIFALNSVGIVTARDDLTIQWSKDAVKKTIERFSILNPEDARREFKLGKDARDWKVELAQQDLHESGLDEKKIIPILYRPFDTRFTYYTGKSRGFHCMPRREVMQHMLKENVGLIIPRQTKEEVGGFVTSNIVGHKAFSAYDINSLFPLFLYENEEKISNLSPEFLKKLSAEAGQKFDIDQVFQIFDYIYGLLYLPRYRQKYAEQLKIDFPRIPLPSQAIEVSLIKATNPKEAFEKISSFGSELRQLHLQTHSIFEDSSKWNVKPAGHKPTDLEDWKVTKVEYDPKQKRVYVNPGQYFENIEEEVWNYHIGGYQVLDKWLKDRKKAGRCLDSQDLIHYCKIVVSLRESINTIKQFE